MEKPQLKATAVALEAMDMLGRQDPVALALLIHIAHAGKPVMGHAMPHERKRAKALKLLARMGYVEEVDGEFNAWVVVDSDIVSTGRRARRAVKAKAVPWEDVLRAKGGDPEKMMAMFPMEGRAMDFYRAELCSAYAPNELSYQMYVWFVEMLCKGNAGEPLRRVLAIATQMSHKAFTGHGLDKATQAELRGVLLGLENYEKGKYTNLALTVANWVANDRKRRLG